MPRKPKDSTVRQRPVAELNLLVARLAAAPNRASGNAIRQKILDGFYGCSVATANPAALASVKRGLKESAAGRRIYRASFAEVQKLTSVLSRRAASKDGAIAKAAGKALSAEAVGKLLGISKAGTLKATDEGRLLAYRLPGKRTYLFPAFQFEGAAVAPWVIEVIDIVGNGFAALHFLTVERKQLKGASYLTRLLAATSPKARAVRIQGVLTAAGGLGFPVGKDDPMVRLANSVPANFEYHC